MLLLQRMFLREKAVAFGITKKTANYLGRFQKKGG